MPDNTQPGILENFVGFLVPTNDTLWDRAKRCVDEIPEAERLFNPNNLGKAEIHTWLAWQEKPGLPLGLAIKARYLDAEAPHARPLVAWLQQLFEL